MPEPEQEHHRILGMADHYSQAKGIDAIIGTSGSSLTVHRTVSAQIKERRES